MDIKSEGEQLLEENTQELWEYRQKNDYFNKEMKGMKLQQNDCAVACEPKQPGMEETLQEILQGVNEGSRMAEVIFGRLYGSNEADSEKEMEPCCIESAITKIRRDVVKLIKKLHEINERL